MRIAAFQCAGGGLDLAARLERLELAVGGTECDLVVTPELFLSGYDVGDEIHGCAEPQDGKYLTIVGALARRLGTAIVYGYPERDGETLYNAAACVDCDGNLIANHRKLLLPPGFEARYFSSGCGGTVFDLGGIRFGMLICYDAEFPESVRAVAEAGADVVLVPTALFNEWRTVAFQMMPTRAFENGVWFVYANHAGREGTATYLGASCIVKPNGEDAARAGPTETLITAELDFSDLSKIRKRLPYVTDIASLRRKLGD